MGKIKVHELAKKIGVSSKEILEKAASLKIEVKNHLATLENSDVKLIEKEFPDKSVQKEEKISGPVIIRREVIMADKVPVKEEAKKEETTKKGIGFVERDTNKDFNIVYRNRPTKPMTASELFGIKNTEKEEVHEVEEKEEIKAETKEDLVKEEVEENKVVAEEKVIEVKKEEQPVVNVQENDNQNRPNNNYNNGPRPYNNNNGYNNQNRPNNNYNNGPRPCNNNNGYNNQNRPNNNYNNGPRPYNNNNGYNNQNRPYNNNYNNGPRPYNNNNNYNNQNRPMDNRRIDKDIKDIVSVEIVEKESIRDYNSRAIDKEKNTRYEEKVKKSPKTKRGENTEIDIDKLRDLKQQTSLSNMYQNDQIFDYYDMSNARGRRGNKRRLKQEETVHQKQKIFQLTDITIAETITVKDLAAALKKTSSDIIKKLLGYGVMATINNEIDFDTATLIASELGVTTHKQVVVTEEEILFDDSEDSTDELMDRAPVVVVMGHVDHGKTSLLDAVRSTNVMEGESGGITQHIGAYKVEIKGKEITFLDTPGHEAFTSMRARGASITDIAILVVAANDGVMPQTIEAVNHAKAAEIPIIVAINKIDLEGANQDRVKQQLMEHGLVPEEWGGDTIYVPISAKKRLNIDNLLETVLLVADMKELKVNPKKQAKGAVIEAKLDKTRGPVATMLVQRGTLDVGDTIVVGSVIGRIRAMNNDKGQKVKKAGPSTPVEIIGLTEVPVAGETFYEVKDEKMAKQLIERRKISQRNKKLNASSAVSLEDLFSQIEKGDLKQLNLIVKADVQGSVEAVKQALEKLSNEEVKVKVIHANTGGVTETDVTLAKVSKAIIIAFNVRPEAIAKETAEKEDIEIKPYSVIYHAIEDVEKAMKGLLDPKFKEVQLGTAEARQIFKVSDVGTIAGCYVTDGKISRNATARVIRDNIVIFEGKLVSLKRFKDDAKEVATGYECGIQIEGFNDIQEGDKIENYIMEEIK